MLGCPACPFPSSIYTQNSNIFEYTKSARPPVLLVFPRSHIEFTFDVFHILVELSWIAHYLFLGDCELALAYFIVNLMDFEVLKASYVVNHVFAAQGADVAVEKRTLGRHAIHFEV